MIFLAILIEILHINIKKKSYFNNLIYIFIYTFYLKIINYIL